MLQGLVVTSDQLLLLSVGDHVCRGKAFLFLNSLRLSTGCTVSRVAWVVQAKDRPHLCSAWGHPGLAIKHSPDTCYYAGLGVSQENANCEPTLAAACTRPLGT